MTLGANTQRSNPRRAELGNASRAMEAANTSRDVWSPTAETFLAALLGCAKEQAEKEAARKAAATRTRIGGKENSGTPVELLAEELIAARVSALAARRQPMCRWTFMRPAIDPSTIENTSETAAGPAATANFNELATEAAAHEPAPLIRWTFMQPAIDPTIYDTLMPAAIEQAAAVAVGEDAPFPVFREIVAATEPVTLPEPIASLDDEEVLPAVADLDESTPAITFWEDQESEEDAVAAAPVAQNAPAAVGKGGPLPAKLLAPGLLSRAWFWLNSRHGLAATKQLRVAETVQLGDKRFVAVVQVEGRKFLIGGGASGVSLLTQLEPNQAGLGSTAAGEGA